MDKQKLAEKIAKKTGHDPETVLSLLAAFVEEVALSLESGEPVDFKGFGCFAVKSIPPWQGHNPETGQIVSLPSKEVPYFQSHSPLRARMNGGRDWKVSRNASKEREAARKQPPVNDETGKQ
ncbi:MAG: HU family DNA-binding protein [Magnetococcales bacterium]|nr:HU family DNA-binding protein [Magnetococcales bacterium]